jgi:hypothetical protein
MERPPFLPERSLVLVSRIVTPRVAERMLGEVPEIRGVVRSGDFVPGIVDPTMNISPRTYELLAGCDVRAGIFNTKAGPIVIFLQQSLIHIEFPRSFNPKIDAVERKMGEAPGRTFIDAACGAGTLGLTAARHSVRHVVMNDAWYAAAFWSAFNLKVNAEFFDIEEIRLVTDYREMFTNPVGKMPKKVAETSGEQVIEVYQGDLFELHRIAMDEEATIVLDLFNKNNSGVIGSIADRLKESLPGEVFIP